MADSLSLELRPTAVLLGSHAFPVSAAMFAFDSESGVEPPQGHYQTL